MNESVIEKLHFVFTQVIFAKWSNLFDDTTYLNVTNMQKNPRFKFFFTISVFWYAPCQKQKPPKTWYSVTHSFEIYKWAKLTFVENNIWRSNNSNIVKGVEENAVKRQECFVTKGQQEERKQRFIRWQRDLQEH